MVSPVAAAPPVPGDPFAPYEVVCELGARPNPVFAVRQPGAAGRSRLLVAEAFAGAGTSVDPTAVAFVSAARRISTLANPNLGRVRELAVRGDDLVVFWEFIDGEALVGTWPSPDMPLEIAVRLILDVLSGVSAMHNLRDAKQRPMALCHGEVSPATVVLGVDGVARVLHTIARLVPGMPPESASIGYLAPEALAGEDQDARADVYGVGVMLWEAMSGRRLFGARSEAASNRREPAPPATAPERSPWAKGLVPVVARALAVAPADRWPTAAAMAVEIRRVAGLKLAAATAAAAFAKTAVGERVERRRARLESAPPGPRPSAAPPSAARISKAPEAPPPAANPPPDTPRRDVSRGEASRGGASRGEASREEMSRGEASRGEMSRGEAPRREPSRPRASRPDAPPARARAPSSPEGPRSDERASAPATLRESEPRFERSPVTDPGPPPPPVPAFAPAPSLVPQRARVPDRPARGASQVGARRWAEDDTSVALHVERTPPAGPAAPIGFRLSVSAPADAPEPAADSLVPEPIDPLADALISVAPPPPLPTFAAAGSPPARPATPLDVPVSFSEPPPAPPVVARAPAAPAPNAPPALSPAGFPPPTSPVFSARPQQDSSDALPTPFERSGEVLDLRGRRRLRAMVLGGVGALGAIVFVIAGLRAMHRPADPVDAPSTTTTTLTAEPPAASAAGSGATGATPPGAPSGLAGSTTTAAPPDPAAQPPVPSPADRAPVSPAPSERPTGATAPAGPRPTPRAVAPTPRYAPPQRKWAPAPRARPSNAARFDPNTL